LTIGSLPTPIFYYCNNSLLVGISYRNKIILPFLGIDRKLLTVGKKNLPDYFNKIVMDITIVYKKNFILEVCITA